jgi:hypothetical protein
VQCRPLLYLFCLTRPPQPKLRVCNVCNVCNVTYVTYVRGPHCIIPGGYQRIVDALSSGLDVRLNSSVSRIEWSGRGTRGPGGIGSGGGADGKRAAMEMQKMKDEEEAVSGGGSRGVRGPGPKDEEAAYITGKEESVLCVGSFVPRGSGAGAAAVAALPGMCCL